MPFRPLTVGDGKCSAAYVWPIVGSKRLYRCHAKAKQENRIEGLSATKIRSGESEQGFHTLVFCDVHYVAELAREDYLREKGFLSRGGVYADLGEI